VGYIVNVTGNLNSIFIMNLCFTMQCNIDKDSDAFAAFSIPSVQYNVQMSKR